MMYVKNANLCVSIPDVSIPDFTQDLTPAQKYRLARTHVVSWAKMYLMYHLDLKLPVTKESTPSVGGNVFGGNDLFNTFHTISLE